MSSCICWEMLKRVHSWTKLLTQFCVTVSLGAGRKLANPLICFFVLRLGCLILGLATGTKGHVENELIGN